MANAIYASNATGAANMTYYTKFAGDNSTNGKGLQGTYEFGLWGEWTLSRLRRWRSSCMAG
jgi:hypothetical protein